MSARPKQITVRLYRRNDWTTVTGSGAPALLLAVDAKLMWSPVKRAWYTNARKGENLLAVADRRGYLVDYSEVA